MPDESLFPLSDIEMAVLRQSMKRTNFGPWLSAAWIVDDTSRLQSSWWDLFRLYRIGNSTWDEKTGYCLLVILFEIVVVWNGQVLDAYCKYRGGQALIRQYLPNEVHLLFHGETYERS